MCDCEKLEEAREDINHYLNSAWRLNGLLGKAREERDDARSDAERANKLLIESFSERDALRQERDEAQNNLLNAEQELADLKEQLEACDRKRDEAVVRAIECSKDVSELQYRIEDLQVEVGDMVQIRADLIRQRDAARAQAAKNAKSMNNQREEIKRLMADTVRLKEEIALWKGRVGQQEATIGKVIAENAEFFRERRWQEPMPPVDAQPLHQEIARLKAELVLSQMNRGDVSQTVADLTKPLMEEIARLKRCNDDLLELRGILNYRVETACRERLGAEAEVKFWRVRAGRLEEVVKQQATTIKRLKAEAQEMEGDHK